MSDNEEIDKEWEDYKKEIQRIWDEADTTDLSYLAIPDERNPEYLKERERRLKAMKEMGFDV